MNPLLRLAVLTTAAGILFAGAAALAMAMGYSRLRSVLARASPARRAAWLLAAVAAPGTAATVLVTACFLPSLAALTGFGVDHCPAHGSHHAHLCFVHLPAQPLGTGGLLLVGTAAAVLAAMTLRLGIAQARAWRSVRALLRASSEDEIQAAGPLAVTVGLWRPRVVVTSELRSLLTPDAIQVVVEHERAHARRRDPLRMTIAAVLALAHLPHVRRAILRDLTLACEEACDEDAASRLCGDRLRVAETLVAVEKLASHASWAPAAFGGGNVTARVESLLATLLPERASSGARSVLGIIAAAGAIAALAPIIHHVTETLLGFLTR
jgi:Zn-dependent protease with chaperone function